MMNFLLSNVFDVRQLLPSSVIETFYVGTESNRLNSFSLMGQIKRRFDLQALRLTHVRFKSRAV